ncbi:hypothetical protein NLS1_19200 [Nocardioides sp. LS1]|nr:hypothetical protein NLS1_19200 [Nocardioides sp. LS1]
MPRSRRKTRTVTARGMSLPVAGAGRSVVVVDPELSEPGTGVGTVMVMAQAPALMTFWGTVSC